MIALQKVIKATPCETLFKFRCRRQIAWTHFPTKRFLTKKITNKYRILTLTYKEVVFMISLETKIDKLQAVLALI